MVVSTFLRRVARAASSVVPSTGRGRAAATIQLSLAATATAATISPPADRSTSPAPSAGVETALDQRLRALQLQLGITEAQMPLWTAYAQAIHDNAASAAALFARPAGAAGDYMHRYRQVARAGADNTKRLAAAFNSLYASLTDTQKQVADTLFHRHPSAAASREIDHGVPLP